MAFAAHFDAAMNRAYTYELWGAAFVLLQGEPGRRGFLRQPRLTPMGGLPLALGEPVDAPVAAEPASAKLAGP